MMPLHRIVKDCLAFFVPGMVLRRFLIALMILNCLDKFRSATGKTMPGRNSAAIGLLMNAFHLNPPAGAD
jgi:hypothetical protein